MRSWEMDETLWCLLWGVTVICFDLNSVLGQISDPGLQPFWRSKRQSCSSSEFQCSSGQCIDSTSLCDGVMDCGDGSDETVKQCTNFRCPSFAFKCSYGGCVDGRSLCNGVEDCFDRSDEEHPSCVKRPDNGNCRNDQFRCQSGKCIDSTLLCDGLKDCPDGSDETFTQCNNFRCPPFTFRCSYGGCIDRTGQCDGRPQCADSSDEDPGLCGTPIKPSCKLPAKPEHGSFTILNCADGENTPLCQKVPDTEAPDYTILEFQCEPGYSLAGRSSNPCVNGAWSNPHPTCEPVLCPKLVSVSVDIRCSLKGNKVDCDKPMAPGTEALLACKIAYQLTNEPGYNKLICQSNGNWDKPVFTCTQECGKRNPNGKPFVSGGQEAKVGEFPWHVGIYRYDNSGELGQICGGSLVNPDTVVSAAHCFWSESFKKTMDKSRFKVAAGKYYRDWNVKDEEMQERELKDIIVHDEYRGRAGLFRNDIAIIKLNVSVQLTWAVLPVCLDVNNDYERFQLVNGNNGSVVGWGVTEKNEASNTLVTTQLPFVDFAICWDTIPETFQSYVTKDKFCAGYTNGTSVCPGDSGGGLAFEYQKRYYLRGVVSIGIEPQGSKKCFTDQYTAFTRVSDFLPWMEPYVR